MSNRFLPLAALVLSALAALPLSAEEPPADLSKLAASFDAARVGESLARVPLVRVGRAEIRPSDGATVQTLVADGRVCGLLISGPARLRYLIEDRFSLPLAQHNLKGLSDGLEVNAAVSPAVIETQLEGAAIWGIDLLPPNAPASAPTTPAPVRALPEWVAQVLASRLDNNPGHDLALSVANGEPGYRWALLNRSGDDLVLDVDARPTVRLESLAKIRRLPTIAGPYAGKWVPDPIVAQPIGRTWWEGTPFTLAAVDTEIVVHNPSGERLEVTTRSTLQAQRDGQQLLALDLLSGIWDEGDSFRPYKITRLTLDGKAAPFAHQEDQLLVARPAPLQRGETTVLEVAVEGEILERPEGDNFWMLGVANWYPKPSAGGFEGAEIRVTADAVKPFQPFAAGEVLRRDAVATGARVATKLPRPMEAATVLAGKYHSITEEQSGSRIHVSTYAAVREEEARRLAQLVFAVRGCYERWLGVPYPFQDLEIVEVNDWGWGQAPPGMIYITKEAFMTRSRAGADEDEEEIAEIATRGVNDRIAHEVAHGWFPHVAKVLHPEENWLSESLSDYASAYCLQASTADARRGRQMFDRQLREWKNLDREVRDGAGIYLAGHLSRLGGDRDEYRSLLYGRGPLVLHAIRQELRKQKGEKEGDRLFLTWIRSYVKNFANRAAETRYLVAILDQITGQAWQPFFERHVYGAESPEVK